MQAIRVKKENCGVRDKDIKILKNAGSGREERRGREIEFGQSKETDNQNVELVMRVSMLYRGVKEADVRVTVSHVPHTRGMREVRSGCRGGREFERVGVKHNASVTLLDYNYYPYYLLPNRG